MADTNIASAADLKQRMASLEKTLQSHASRASLGATLTLLLGIVLLVGLGFYFWYGYTHIIGFLTPKNLVESVETQVVERIPEYRVQIEGSVKENAPSWAKLASSAMLEGIPSAREYALNASLSAFDDVLNKGTEHSKDVLAKHIQENRGQFKEAVRKLSAGDKASEAYIHEITESFAKALEVDTENVIKSISDFAGGFNELLAKTGNANARLTNLQAMQREILMLAKRALLEHAPAPIPEEKKET